MRDMLLEELMSMGMFLTQSNTSVSLPAFQLMEPVQEVPAIPPELPWESNFGGNGRSQPFLNIGKTIPYLCSLFLFESSSSLMALGQVRVISSLNIMDIVKCASKLPSLCVLQP